MLATTWQATPTSAISDKELVDALTPAGRYSPQGVGGLPGASRADCLERVAGERDRRHYELVAEEVEQQPATVLAHAQIDSLEDAALVSQHDAAEHHVERQHQQGHRPDDREVAGHGQQNAGDEREREGQVDERKQEV